MSKQSIYLRTIGVHRKRAQMNELLMDWGWGGLFLLFLIPKLLKFIIFGIITLFYQLLMYNIGVRLTKENLMTSRNHNNSKNLYAIIN